MAEHRLRLSDEDLALIAAALRARLAMLRGPRRERVERLLLRLADGGKGNPNWRFHDLVDGSAAAANLAD